MAIDLVSMILANDYTEESLLGGGAVVGKNVTISSITSIEGGNRVTFSYTLDNGTVNTSTMDVKDGVSITSISVDSNNYLVCTMSDGTEQKAKINFLDNVYTKTETDNLLKDKADKTHNHNDLYASKDTEHEHSNKETLDKFGVNDGGKLTFNGDVVIPEASDLSDYLKKTDAQNTYVEKETGKGLSENDFTTVLKEAYDKAVEDSHTHSNKSVIDKFSESADGALLYDGQSIEADLSDVYKKTETYSQTEADEKFVSKELGKGLSTNDLTDELKTAYDEAVTAKHTHENGTILDGITAEKVDAWDKAEENVQSDWNETDETADGFIKNKPTIPEAYDDTTLSGRVKTIEDDYVKSADIPQKVSELQNDSNYQTAEQVNSTVTTEIAKVVADAPEDLNTLKEMSDWIAGHEDDASAMNSAISDNKTAITALQTDKADKSEIPTTVAELTDSADYAKTADIPTTLPANGGNADTVNNHTVKSDVPENAVFTDTVLEVNDADVSKTKVWSSDKTASEIASAIAGGEVDLSAYQKKNDTGLCTMAQDIVGAINEVKEAVDSKVNYDDTEVKADIAGLQTKAHTHANTEVLDGITSENIQSWDNKSEFDGNYDALTNKPTLPVKLSDLTNDSGYITNIADDLLNYYKKSDTYSKEEIAELIGNINKLTSEIVESLPTENISTSTIYLIKEGDTNNYKQYMYISGAWAQLSDTNIDLSGYAKLTDLDTKVDKVTGKTLSTNDFTNVLKSKLDGIAEGANKTVVDVELSTTSTNPVQNAVVTTKINTLANKDGSDATGTWGIDISGTAAKATADKNGNDITTTYAKQADFEKAVGNVDIINYTDQIIKNTDVVAYMFSTNIRKVGHIVTFVINITVKAVPSAAVVLGTIPKGVRPPADVSYNVLTNNGDACYVYIDSNGKFGIRKISATEFAANDGVRFCANYITEE